MGGREEEGRRKDGGMEEEGWRKGIMMGTKVEWRREERIYTRSCLFVYTCIAATCQLQICLAAKIYVRRKIKLLTRLYSYLFNN